jgi:membrane-associated phospholipid phosphatase
LLRFTWCFFLLNLVGFITYHLYPAAPPWYFHAFGCHVDLSTAAHEGPNLLRVDERLGFPYFASFYRRSSDVFGAMPSLHVAYPLLLSIEGVPLHGLLGRVLLIGFYLAMCFSAVYLDHHWLLDVLAGSLLTVMSALVVRRFINVAAHP